MLSMVTDSSGAKSRPDEVSIIRNHGPDPVVDMKHGTDDPIEIKSSNNPINLYMPIQLDASRSTDKDPKDSIVKYSWSQAEFSLLAIKKICRNPT
jgi:hypothetical protein